MIGLLYGDTFSVSEAWVEVSAAHEGVSDELKPKQRDRNLSRYCIVDEY